MTTKTTNKHALLPFETIEAATTGDVCAINTILQHYNGYILTLSSRPCVDPFGNLHMVVDPEMKRRLETKLITRILKFRVA